MSYLYVSSMEDHLISIFGLSPDSGALSRIEEVPVPGGPAPMTTDPSNRRLFVARRADNHLSSYQRNLETGRLTLVNSVRLETDPCYIATDHSGRFLFSAYYGAGLIGVHQIGPDGSLAPEPVEWRITAERAHCIQADPSNRFVFVPHIANRGGANAILQFRFDAETGKLSPNSPDRVTPSELDGPRHFCFHPSRPLVYCSNEQGSSVTVYAFDSTKGTLSSRQTVATLPLGFDDENSCSQILITPSGRFLYAPNRGHDSIAIFAVDENSGLLRALGHQATEKVPRAFGIDPSGKYLFVAGLETGRLASYRIDQQNGELKAMEVHAVGAAPMWVLAR